VAAENSHIEIIREAATILGSAFIRLRESTNQG